MRAEQFATLTPEQRDTLLVSMIIRNAMEDFHADNLSDSQMKELNPIIRQAVFDALNLLSHVRDKGDSVDPLAWQQLQFQMSLIPDYWEIPDQVSEDFVQFNPHEQYRNTGWIKKPELMPLYERFLRLGDFKYARDDIHGLEAFLAQDIAPDETNPSLRWSAAQDVIDDELASVIRKMRELGATQQQLINARGSLSRSDLRKYF